MASYCGVRHAVGVGSGTDALALALGALGVGPGTRVLTTPFSFFATASTIVRLGGAAGLRRHRPADAEPRPGRRGRGARTGRRAPSPGSSRCISSAGWPTMRALRALADRHGLWLVEDAAQAIGARVDGRRAGRLRQCRLPLVLPHEEPRRHRGRRHAAHGGRRRSRDVCDATGRTASVAPYVHESLGLCSRLDAVQAAALGAKLPHLDGWNDAPATRGGLVRDASSARAGSPVAPGAPVVLPDARGRGARLPRLHRPRARSRRARAAPRARAGIGTQVYYRVPLHRQAPLAACAEVPAGVPRGGARRRRGAGAADVSAARRGAGGARRRRVSRRSTVPGGAD